MPRFSVVIPIYNRASTLSRLLLSLDKQTYRDFEVVLVDDGSDDEPEKAIPSELNYELRLIKQANAGGSAARNAGIRGSNGDYIAFLDSDDFFAPEKLEVVATYIANTGATFLYSYAKVDRGNGVFGQKPERGLRGDEPFEEYALVARQAAQTSTLVIERQLALSTLFDPDLKKFQDIDFCIRLARNGAKIVFIPEPLSIWTDFSADGRVGNVRKPEAALLWLSKHGTSLNKRALLGFKANILSYEIGQISPLKALGYVIQGALFGGVSPKRTAQSLVRALAPQSLYRPLVNRLLKKN